MTALWLSVAAAPLVKICGLRRVDDIRAARDAGADLVGLIFAPSKRRVTVDEARALLAAVPDHPPAVGVFVDADPLEMDRVADSVGLAFVQLSGHERSDAAARLRTPYLKVVHVGAGGEDESLHIMSMHRTAKALIIDSPSPQGGGSGAQADWKTARVLVARCEVPVLLAGGLNPDNVGEGLTYTGAAGADVSSGVEIDGNKDADRIRAFIAAVRRAGKTAPYSK